MADPDNRHSVSVAGVVVDRAGRALLIRRRDNAHWEAPGDIPELQEPIEAGREVKEGTGLDVDPVALTGVYKRQGGDELVGRGVFVFCYVVAEHDGSGVHDPGFAGHSHLAVALDLFALVSAELAPVPPSSDVDLLVTREPDESGNQALVCPSLRERPLGAIATA
jgi:ADP-ribose pyrophosphatase YjhB (NUDIX family)